MTEFDPTTKITRRTPVNKAASRYSTGVIKPTPTAETVDRVTLSQSSPTKVAGPKKLQSAGEVRQELVKKFKDYLEEGTYKIKAEEIADKMVQKIRENKNRQII